MNKNYTPLCENIMLGIGGIENISSVTHCMTRLRFSLIDNEKVNSNLLENTPGVMKTILSGGQYQVVIGNNVTEVYELFCKMYSLKNNTDTKEQDMKPKTISSPLKRYTNAFMNTISSILSPVLGVLAAAGIIKGLISLFLALNYTEKTSGLYMLLYALGDGFFYFFPILLGFTSAKKFKCNEFIGAAIGCSLVYPSIVNINSLFSTSHTLFTHTIFEMHYYNTFLGIPIVIPETGYIYSVIPIILAVFIASKIEHLCNTSLPAAIKGILTPLISVLCSVIITYLVVGPLSMIICGIIAQCITFLYEIPYVGGIIAGTLVGGGFGILVMFGLHWVLISLGLSTIAIQGFDFMLACASIGPLIGMFQGIALCIASYKHKKIFDLALPATISQICGVGEPLMYSILIPLKKPLILNIIGGAFGGAIIGFLKTKMYLFGGAGLFSIPNFINPETGNTVDVMKYLTAILISGIFTFIVQLCIYNKTELDNLK